MKRFLSLSYLHYGFIIVIVTSSYKVFERFLSEHSYIYIGALIGQTVLYGAQIAKNTYAVEPDPIALKHLKTNLMFKQDFLNKITLFEGCIGESDGQTKIGTNSHFGDSMSRLLSHLNL